MSGEAVPMIPAPHTTAGALFIGMALAGAFFGISCLQTYTYYNDYKKDPWHTKTLVAVVFVFDLLHQIFITHTMYEYLIVYYGNPAMLFSLPWSLTAEVECTGIISALVQGFYSVRVYRLSKKWWLGALVALPIVPSFILNTYYLVIMAGYTSLGQLGAISGIVKAINVLNSVDDVLIAIVMIYLLNSGRTGLRSSDTIINRLLIFVINTGLLTSVCQVATMICSIASPTTMIYAIFFFLTPRLYANSLFATLNARTSIRQAVSGEAISLSSAARRAQTQASATLPNVSTNTQNGIHIDVETTMDRSDSEMYMKKMKSLDSGHAV